MENGFEGSRRLDSGVEGAFLSYVFDDCVVEPGSGEVLVVVEDPLPFFIGADGENHVMAASVSVDVPGLCDVHPRSSKYSMQ